MDKDNTQKSIIPLLKVKAWFTKGELESPNCVANKGDTEDDIEEQLRKYVE